MTERDESERDQRCARLRGLSPGELFDKFDLAELVTELDASARDRTALAKAPTWRRVEDELPELDVDVLTCCFNPEFHNQRRYVFVNHLDHQPSHWAKGHKVTHWMPLPEPPNA